MSAIVSLPGPVSVRDVLRQYVRDQPNGETLDYVSVEQATGICLAPGKDGAIGRKALRDAARAEGREFVVLYKIGIRLMDGGMALHVIKADVCRLGQQAAKTGQRADRIVTKHGDDMPTEDRQAATKMVSFLNTLKLSAANAAKDRGVKLLK